MDRSATIQLADLSNDWRVTFTSTKETETESTLTDWTTHPATLYYSGEAVLTPRRDPQQPSPRTHLPSSGRRRTHPDASATCSFRQRSPRSTQRAPGSPLPNPLKTGVGPGMRAWYDPPIHEAAIVFINGQRASSLWHPPYRLDVSKLLKPGQNHIEIHVYNTALNAWSALPPHDYKPLIEKYGDRFQMQDLDKVQPIPSGLLGTIHLVTQDAQ